MVEETPVTVAAQAAPVVEAVPAVVVAEPVAPAVETSATPVSETPVVQAEPIAEVKTDAADAAKPLLGPDADESKVEAPKTEGELEKTEPAPLPVYEFKLPEGANTDNPIFKSFQNKLGEFQNLSKAEQAAVQKFGQEMLDMHMEDIKGIVENQNKASWDWFNNRNKEWLESAKKDPTIGGDSFGATVSAASQAVSLYGGTKSQQIETAKLLQETGLENSPIMLRFLSNITKIAAKEGTPVAGSNVPAQKFNPAQALFGGAKSA